MGRWQGLGRRREMSQVLAWFKILSQGRGGSGCWRCLGRVLVRFRILGQGRGGFMLFDGSLKIRMPRTQNLLGFRTEFKINLPITQYAGLSFPNKPDKHRLIALRMSSTSVSPWPSAVHEQTLVLVFAERN